MRVIIADSHGQKQQEIQSVSIELEGSIISAFKWMTYCVKKVRIRSYSGPYFPVFWLNIERYSLSLRIQSECEKIRTRITRNMDTFYSRSDKLWQATTLEAPSWGKEKKKCYRIVKKSEFQEAFAKLSDTRELFENIFNNIYQFMKLYNSSEIKMGAVPYELFNRKIRNPNKMIFLSLSPFKKILRLHVVRSVCIVALRKTMAIAKPDILDIYEFSCYEDGKVTGRKGVFKSLSNIQNGVFC